MIKININSYHAHISAIVLAVLVSLHYLPPEGGVGGGAGENTTTCESFMVMRS